jgi:hypothetical protein
VIGRRARAARLLALTVIALGAAALGVGTASALEYGKPIVLTGTVPNGAAGERVDIMALAYGSKEYAHVAVVSTQEGGRWRWTARPRIRTTYRAVWNLVPTSRVVVRVSPELDLTQAKKGLLARARSETSLTGRRVTVQLRRPGGNWRVFRRVVLGPGARSIVKATLPIGRSFLRLHMTAAEAGPGYDAGYSPVLNFTRKANDGGN